MRTQIRHPDGTLEVVATPRHAMRCSPAQMRLVLAERGILGQVAEIAMANPQAAILWEYATEFHRTSPLIDALAAGHFTPEQIDDLFHDAMAR